MRIIPEKIHICKHHSIKTSNDLWVKCHVYFNKWKSEPKGNFKMIVVLVCWPCKNRLGRRPLPSRRGLRTLMITRPLTETGNKKALEKKSDNCAFTSGLLLGFLTVKRFLTLLSEEIETLLTFFLNHIIIIFFFT